MNAKRIKLAAIGLAFTVMMGSGLSIISMSGLTISPPSSGARETDAAGNPMPHFVSMADSTVDASTRKSDPAESAMHTAAPDIGLVKRVELDPASEVAQAAQRNLDGITESIVPNEQAAMAGSDFDLGGPYGGPNCFEGSCVIHFEITTSDPKLIFFRWDFNNDSIWDTPWLTDRFYDRVYYDNYHGNVVAEGWDGISTRTVIVLGTNLRELKDPYWAAYPANIGWKFKTKTMLDALKLGFYQHSMSVPGIVIKLWDLPSKALLGTCTPSIQNDYSWNWCALSTPIHLTYEHEYMISSHMNADYASYWWMLNNPDVPWDKVQYEGGWYAWGLPNRMPDTEFGGGNTYVPMIDFRWRQVLMMAYTKRDTATLEVVNVPPSPFNVTADSNPVPEGTPVRFTAWFNDPGLDDEWQYRWSFDNSTWSPWKEVSKISGGAKVLIYHTMTGDITDFRRRIESDCGSFCIAVDEYDFGELGHNKQLTLDELMAYDVLFVEINYLFNDQIQAGNLLADYMDLKGDEGSGGIVMGNGPFIANSQYDIRGRYFDDGYSPIVKAGYNFGDWHLSTIYIPGHPILDGVTTLTSYMHVQANTLTSGATRVADWDTGYIAVATKLNPIVNNGARSVAMPWAAWLNCKGNCIQTVVNALRWASRQSDPILLSMPIQLPWISHTYGDDDPVTTSPSDNFTVALQVKDDDHLKIDGWETAVYSQDFTSGCNGSTFPPGWTNEPITGWQCTRSSELNSNAAAFWYYNNDYNTSLLSSRTVNLGSYRFGKVEWRQLWWANYGGSSQDGYVEASIDGGQTYPTLLKEFHHNQPGYEIATYKAEVLAVSSQFKVRYRIESNNDYAWIIDDFKVSGMQGSVEWGLGNASSEISVSNVEPSVIGGPSSDTAYVGIPYEFNGLNISDPALWMETEWFAYRFDFGDGSPAQWVFKGNLTPPKQDVLIIHSMCMTGDSCPELTELVDMLRGLDLVGSVSTYNFFEKLSAPTLNYMLGFDVVMFATNWAYLNFPPYDATRILIGNNMASYLDLHAGGIVTWMYTYDLSPIYGDSFSLLGRYMDQDYGPFERGKWLDGDAYFPPTIMDPSHPVMEGLNASRTQLVTSSFQHSGNLATTSGGLRLASWNDGGAAVGVKDFNNDGRRSCAINAYAGGYGGPSAPLLLRNCIRWVIGGLPSPEIPKVTHAWASPGTYVVDISIIDDDMGWTWDSLNGVPVVDPAYPQTIAHRYIQIDVQS